MMTKLNLQNHDQHRLAQHPNKKDQTKVRTKVCVETLTTDLLVEGVFAKQPPPVEVTVVLEFPPTVELEGAVFPVAVLRVGSTVLAAPLCSTTTQLPKPAPEINCYTKVDQSEKKTTPMSVENLLQDTYYSGT